MTDSERQEAIKIIKSECYISDLLDLDWTRMVNTALDMAVKALEQTSALDKARAEIASYGSIWVEYNIPGHTDHDIETIVENVLKQAKEQVLAVLDKYKAESEDKEVNG